MSVKRLEDSGEVFPFFGEKVGDGLEGMHCAAFFFYFPSRKNPVAVCVSVQQLRAATAVLFLYKFHLLIGSLQFLTRRV